MLKAMCVVVSLLLFGAACGGSTSSTDSGADGDVSAGTFTPEEVVDALVETIPGGPAVAGLAVLMAVDRGYEPGRVLEAAVAGELRAEGFVVGDDESVVTPEGSDGGVITDKPTLPTDDAAAALSLDVVFVAFEQRAPIQNVTAAELGERLRRFSDGDGGVEDAGNLMLQLIIRQLGHGFSIEQIVTAFVLGIPEECTEDDYDNSMDCVMAGEVPAGPEIASLLRSAEDQAAVEQGRAEQGQNAGVGSALSGDPDDPSDTNSGTDQSPGDDQPEGSALIDGIYAGQFQYDYALFWAVAPENLHDSRDVVEGNAVTVIVTGGVVEALSGRVATFFAAPDPDAGGALACETRTTFDLQGDVAGQIVEDGVVEMEVFISGARVSNCPSLDWTLSDFGVRAQIVQDDGSIGLVLTPFDAGYVLTANIPAS